MWYTNEQKLLQKYYYRLRFFEQKYNSCVFIAVADTKNNLYKQLECFSSKNKNART